VGRRCGDLLKVGYDTNVNFSIVFLLKEIPAFAGMTIFKVLFFQKAIELGCGKKMRRLTQNGI
jgi:hypothetical protein